MKCLIVEDDFVSRKVLQKAMSPYAECHVAVDGQEAIDACELAWQENDPYQLILLDIMMPNVDGQEALKQIRALEKKQGIKEKDGAKIVMTTALDDPKNVVTAYYDGGANAYLTKPYDNEKLMHTLKDLELV
ncbi:MAG: response regulator [Thermodesulfobacteriota bacterium]